MALLISIAWPEEPARLALWHGGVVEVEPGDRVVGYDGLSSVMPIAVFTPAGDQREVIEDYDDEDDEDEISAIC